MAGIAKILYSLVLEAKTYRELSKPSKLEWSGKISANKCTLSDPEDET